MKKSVGFIGLVITAALCFGLNSCKNFLNSSGLKNELESAIDYANAPSYTLRVQAVEGTGTITSHSGDNSLKVTDHLNISFSIATGYKFIKWHAYLKSDATVSMDEYVTFDPDNDYDTVLTLVKGAQNIVVEPVCEKTLAITETSPVYSTEGVARDNSIKLTFSAPLSQNNDLSKIDITITGINADGKIYFNDPLINNNQLIITAKTENRIPVKEGETQTVTVTLPSDLKYLTDSGELEADTELFHSYVINSSTLDKTNLVYCTSINNEDTSATDAAGILKVNGITATLIPQTYSVGQTTTVTFKVADGYEFVEWQSDTEAVTVIPASGDDYDENGYNAETSTATATVVITGSTTNATLTAVTTKIPTANILITAATGKISPNSTLNCIQGKGNTLIFNADSDYQFIKWQVIDYNTGDDLTDDGYITFEKPAEFNTDFTLVKAPASDSGLVLSIQPLCKERPQIISQTPLYSAAGVYRDTRIMITFNQKMSEDSIYYSAKEAADLTADGNTLLYSTENDGTKNYYGYKNSSGEIFFKNIKITNFQSGANILENYDAPYFDSPQVLYIPTMPNEINEDGTIKTAHAPAAGCQPYIEISKNVFYNDEDGNEIYLGSNKVWNYRVNSKIDNEAPEFDLSTLKVSASTGFEDAADVNLTALSSSPSDLATYKAAYLKDKKIKVFAEFSDQGSGPAGFVRVCYEKVLDSYYKTVTASTKESGYEKLEPVIDGTNAYVGTINGTSNIPETVDFSGRSDGLYKVWLECEDVNGYRGYSYTNENSADTYYYVLVDDENSAPYKVASISGARDSASQEDLTWTPEQTQTPDFDHYEINCYVSGSSDVSSTQSTSTASVSFTGLTNQTKYSYSICAYDVFGNKTEYTSYVDNTAPYIPTSSWGSRTTAASETVNWSYSSRSADLDHVVVERYIYGISTKPAASSNIDKATTNCSFGSLTNQVKYSYRIYAVDYSGNQSSSYREYVDNTAPKSISSLTGSRSSATSETISWSYSASQTSDFAKIIVGRYENGTKIADTGNKITSSSTTSYDFTGLTDQHKYTYYAYAVDYAGNQTATVSYVDNTAPAQCVSSCSGSRSSAANEALTWTYTTKSTDFSHVVIERYISGNSSAAETFTATSATETTNTFTGLTDQTKYSYRIYSVDYASNKSSTYYSYVDSTAPSVQAVKTFAKNGEHYLKVTHSNDPDWSKTVIYQDGTLKRTYYPSTVTDKKSSDTYSVNTGTASTYTIRTYDFASNYSDSVITEKFTPGAIYYNDNNLTSSNYYSDMTPIGVLMYTGDKSNNKSPRIWGLDEVSGYCWGSKGDKVGNCSATTNGLSNYKEMSAGTNKGSVLNLSKLWGTDDTTNGNCESFTNYLYYDRNTKDELTGNKTVTWYAPACDELSTYLQPNIKAVKATFTLLDNKGVKCTFNEKNWIWSSTEWDKDYAKQIASYNVGYHWSFSKNRHKVAHGDDGTTETYCHFMAQVDNLY